MRAVLGDIQAPGIPLPLPGFARYFDIHCLTWKSEGNIDMAKIRMVRDSCARRMEV